ncbi:MAG: type II methionyl aminopeptidase [Ignisphaera sp.]|nr:type II methionyl aminopeptidase [Ignisphaera sp.]
MTDEELEEYLKAGRIACTILNEAASYIRPGMKLIDVAEYIENRIESLGGKPAFPTNISINNIAAHYTPTPNDTSVIPEGSVVKIDLGVHVDGYIADTAITLTFNEEFKLLSEAAKTALERAIEAVAPGVRFSRVGRIVEDVIKSYGFKPIYNLSGHSIDRYMIHSGDVIPNYEDRLNLGSFRRGKVYAIEPFATNGRGYVKDGAMTTIYALKPNPKKIAKLDQTTREIFEHIYEDRKTLPFALRWYTRRFPLDQLENSMKILVSAGLAIAYPVLVEVSNGIVAQFEHTIVISDKGEKVITTRC